MPTPFAQRLIRPHEQAVVEMNVIIALDAAPDLGDRFPRCMPTDHVFAPRHMLRVHGAEVVNPIAPLGAGMESDTLCLTELLALDPRHGVDHGA